MNIDEYYMKRALRLAARARGLTSPNPMVGAVLVKHGTIIAEGYHRRQGKPHAEALVIAEAGKKARGATLYVSLEPCCHLDKQTPPCTRAIISSGIKKVAVAMQDPNPKVSGKGIKELKDSGIEVCEGILEQEAKKLNEAYAKYITTGIPFVILKTAMTLDGKIATADGESKWITGEKARRLVHRLRSMSDAVLTAVGTVKADNPALTARIRGGKNPLRIVIDPHLEMPLEYEVAQVPPDTILVIRSDAGEKQRSRGDKRNILESRGIQFIEYETDRVDLKRLMEVLGKRGITSVLIEGGSSLNASALNDGIVDKIVWFVALKLICGSTSYPVTGGEVCRKLSEAHLVKDIHIRRIGGDILIEGYL